MMNQGELFLVATAQGYPNFPGAKVGGTSMQSAFAIAQHAKTVRGLVLREYLKTDKPMTPDQVAAAIGESILTVRPRCSELKRAGMLEPAPITLANPTSGHQARALRATAKAREVNR